MARILSCFSFLLTLALGTGAAAWGQSILNQYGLQPEVWRPAKPIEPGVDAQGDLGLSVPVLTVPGRNGLDFQVNFSYRSSIKPSQESGWIGLGWNFDPGSVTRDVQNLNIAGTPCQLYNVDYTAIPAYQQDLYNVTTPAGSFTMGRYLAGQATVSPARLTTGNFAALEWRPWKIEYEVQTPVAVSGVESEVLQNGVYTNKEEFRKFIITAEDGTRYIFGDLSTTGSITLASPRPPTP
jgi:hypothetical protein